MFKLLKDILKFSDYFGRPVQMLFNNKSKFNTVLGGIMTLIILSLAIAVIINSGQELVTRKSPKTNQNILYNKSSPLLYLNSPDSSFFSFKFVDKFGKPFYDESYFRFVFSLEKKKKKSSLSDTKIEELNLIDCSNVKEYFVNSFVDFSEEVETNEIDKSKCIQRQSLPVGVSPSYDYLSYIHFQIVKCNNNTSNNNCKNEKEIEEILGSSTFYLYFIDRYIDLEDIYAPFKTYFNSYLCHLEPYIIRSTDMYFKKTIVVSDKGVMFQEITNFSSILFESYREELEFFDAKYTDTIFSLYINSSKNVVNINRIYMKLGDLTAMIGGILQICIVIGNIITDNFIKYKMYQKIMNTLYDFNVFEKSFDGFVVKKLRDNVYSRYITKNRTFVENIKKQTILENNMDYNIEKMQVKRRENVLITPDFNKSLILDSERILKNIEPQSSSECVFKNERILIRKPDNNNKHKTYSITNYIGSASNKVKERIFYFEVLRKIQNYKKTMLGKLQLSYYNIIGMLLCKVCSRKMKKKFELIKLTEIEMKKYFDYLEIAKLLQEFTIMKLVLFTKDQHFLFSFISKPQISYKDDTLKNSYLHGKIFDRENVPLDKLFDIYIKLQEKGNNKSLIEKNILENLDEDLKKTFDLAIKKTIENVNINN